ncbi:hypothetical protein N7495_008393 [Penicillium taxi]|uniref:uncharacterized protein n=1 Tax=Penicillium taxi TaxID=168475 RepID=UPI002545415D|nr:uncharacterized protein N7495_008393 [Penicillium taxi]KAJ5888352.1 hypothetical protein N7495_008393 [Penicillium taxi]
MADPCLCQRSETVAELSAILDRYPYNYGHYRILEAAHKNGYTDITDASLFMADIVIIIDEAQLTYADSGLWLGLIKGVGEGLWPTDRLILVVWNGFAALRPAKSDNEFPIFNPPNIGLFYTRAEFDDAITLSYPSHSNFVLDQSARDHIFKITNGHPGAVNSFSGFLQEIFRKAFHEGKPSIDEQDIRLIMTNPQNLFKYLGICPVRRSFAPIQTISRQAVYTLRAVLINGSIPRDLSDPGINECYSKGWLHGEPINNEWTPEMICVFPSKLHARFIEHYFLEHLSPFPFDRFPKIETLVEAVLRNFSRRNLCNVNRFSVGALLRPVETCYQDEFYRSIHEVLGPSMDAISEWSGDGIGKIDFRLGATKWGIEILKEGDRLDAHIHRFLPGGQYHGWMQAGLITDWLIIDCRTTNPRTIRNAHLWRAVFCDDFSFVKIMDSNNEQLMEFPLKF